MDGSKMETEDGEWKVDVCKVDDRPTPEIMREIIKQKEETHSFYVFKVDEVVRQVERWRQLLPQIHIFYAAKCNSYKPLLEILVSLQVGFDCASQGEMDLVTSIGSPASHIILANPYKPVPSLHRASDLQVSLMTFDSFTELRKIKQHYPKARLVLRIRYDDSKAKFILGNKYGVRAEKAKPLLEEAWALGLQVVGVAFHVGTLATQPEVYYQAIATARTVFDEAKNIGFSPDLLDIGGGFPGQDDALMVQMANQINAALTRYFPHPDVKVIAEPGKYLVTTSFSLATIITGRKEANGTPTSPVIQYYTDESVYLSFHWVKIGYTFEPPEVLLRSGEAKGKEDERCTLWGGSCAPIDLIAESVSLPPDLEFGSWLLWRDMGAYTLASASHFCGLVPSPVYPVISSRLLRSNIITGLNLGNPQRTVRGEARGT